MKSIAREVHLPSVVQSEFYESDNNTLFTLKCLSCNIFFDCNKHEVTIVTVRVKTVMLINRFKTGSPTFFCFPTFLTIF